ncbi:helix-turn-helix transcriptional regulator [Peptoniphilus sp. AGMB00490]|uniref:Helix-turn-helix transcriptional regulator n=2 Tax=Peptoniphilus TaxID=162289 RepID=A0ACD6B031_9FIRM|nr:MULTISPECIES: metalloregulator ArsR/SmtB family transcription factor [Peptoniphilus]NMW84812.1 helix-turn-helix transcriptional regulator [Peptoniphilus faecalis]OLR65695.1 ArsR family transcriptional regulator [Peptoniphilus porci]
MRKEIDNLEKTAEVLKVMAHPIRLKIIKNLIDNGPCNVGSLQEIFNIPQPTVSSHLGKLKRAGVLNSDRNGTEIFYKVDNKFIISLAKIIFD